MTIIALGIVGAAKPLRNEVEQWSRKAEPRKARPEAIYRVGECPKDKKDAEKNWHDIKNRSFINETDRH